MVKGNIAVYTNPISKVKCAVVIGEEYNENYTPLKIPIRYSYTECCHHKEFYGKIQLKYSLEKQIHELFINGKRIRAVKYFHVFQNLYQAITEKDLELSIKHLQ